MKKGTEQIVLILGVLAGAGITSFALNNLPMIRDTDPRWKSLIQIGGGMALLWFAPNSWQVVKVAGVGAITAGGISAIEKFSGGKIKMLAGPRGGGRQFSDAELTALRRLGQMRSPVQVTRGNMGRPAEVRGNGAAIPTMAGTGNGGWGNGGW
jgi:hypothetical protein